MTDTSTNGTRGTVPPNTAIAIAPPVKKGWLDQLPIIIATAMIGLMFTVGQNFGSRISSTTDKTIELNAVVQQISEDLKEQKADAKEARINQQQMIAKLNDVYTRSEAQRDRDEFRRQVAAIESQINIINGRLDRTDNTIRMLQDTLKVSQDNMKIVQDMIMNRNLNPQRH
jgi:chromosome segregation ATPase